ncbi:hypothetical protein NM688_g6420 [Phlebia brevispora]|uniref:Uncharacterized protein n=1 Tax=Phlebia brevispora TaxID=194682 RepID=A0ACC1SGA3_9APHY|nr:hypothetical protein NM688_g6420 [Phlebia brevispora]
MLTNPLLHPAAIIAISAVAVHLIFKRWEPLNIPAVFSLLVVVPALLSLKFLAVLLPFTAFLLFYSSLLLSIVVYRLSPFHPLASYPGPVLLKISKLRMVWIVKTGKRHLYIRRLHQIYGDVVRIGPNEISICDASIVPRVLGSSGLPKGPSWDGRGMYQEVPSLTNCRDPQYHAQRRKPWDRAFNSAALREYKPRIIKRVTQLVDGMSKQEGPVDLAQWLSFFTYDFMGDMIYGGGTEMMRDGDRDGLWKIVRDGLEVSIVFDTIPWLSYYVKWIPGTGKDLKRLHKMAFGRTRARFQSGSAVKDVFYYLSNEDHAADKSPPESVVVSDGVTAVIAGSDTTAGVLSNTFYLLLCHPDKYARLEAEVDQFYPPEEDSLNDIHHPEMVYMEAVLNEALRLFPALPSGSQRSPAPGKGDRMVGKYFVPNGTQVRLHPYTMQRDARNFTDPDTFWPERWLIASGHSEYEDQHAVAGKIIHNTGAFIPFSFGPNNCAGKSLAMQEMRTVVCHLVHTLRVSPVKGWEPQHWEDQLEDKFPFGFGVLPVNTFLQAGWLELGPMILRISSITRNDVLGAVAAAGLIVHMIFKRWEPVHIPTVCFLLVVHPLVASLLLAPHFEGISVAVAARFFTFYGALLTSIICYRLSPFHPIVKHPRPVLYKSSRLYLAWIASKGCQHKYDFMGDMAFRRTGMLQEGDIMANGQGRTRVIFLLYDHIPWLSHFTNHIPCAGKDLKKRRTMAINRAFERYNGGARSKDILFYLYEDSSETKTPSRNTVISDAVPAVVAGSDTTATILSNIFWSLLRYPETYRRLQAEVDEFYALGEGSLDIKHHVSIPYLEAVIN